jgi:hypothetical protein
MEKIKSSSEQTCAVGDAHFFDLGGEGGHAPRRRPWWMWTTAWGDSSKVMASPSPPQCSRSRASSPSGAPPPFSMHTGYTFGLASWNL